ncbi:ArsR/SmtB family transcription factor [Sphingomonas sp. 7/4-4]|uniref:ArsR/SmtB family transcription factor n=1 Tax=Sphingomonas sp. 7/4-4 TaxID=3018446 RepID=UPI00300DEC96
MLLPTAVEALSALAHGHRLAVFRLLVRAGADGLPAGEIAREVGVLPNTLSTHLTILGHAELVHSRREGRSVIYSANYGGCAICSASWSPIAAPAALKSAGR